MKNLFKNLSKLFVLLLVIPVIAVSLSACKPKDDKKPDDGKNNPPVEEVDDNPNSPIKSGIYTFKNGLSLANMWYDNKDGNELFIANYLKTRDRNGIRDAVEKMGFLDFCASTTRTDDNLEKVIEFDANNNVTTYAIQTNGFYSKLSSFNYVYNPITGLFNTSEQTAPAIVHNEKDHSLKLYFEFKYYKEEDEKECRFHKIYAEATLEYSCDTFISMTKAEKTQKYAVKANSAQIVKGETSTLPVEELNSKLATIFNLKDSTEPVKDVEKIISEYEISVFNDFTMSTIYKSSENSLTFSYNAISGQSLAVNGIHFVISTKAINESPAELTVFVALDGDSIFQFVVEKI